MPNLKDYREVSKITRKRLPTHSLLYSGYTLEMLLEKSAAQPSIAEILDQVDVLEDVPLVEAQSHNAGSWTGNGNQRVIDLNAAGKQHRRLVLFATEKKRKHFNVHSSYSIRCCLKFSINR